MASDNTIIESLFNNSFLTGKARAAFNITAKAIKAEDPSWVSGSYSTGNRIQDENWIFEVTTGGATGGSKPEFSLTPVGGTITDGAVTWQNKGERMSPRQVFADKVLAGQVNYQVILPAMLDQLNVSSANDYGFDETALPDSSWESAASALFNSFASQQT